MNLVQNYSDHFGNSQRSSLSPTGQGVKSTSPTEQKMATKTVRIQHINTSDEDKHDTNYINKHKYTNHDTRKLHL